MYTYFNRYSRRAHLLKKKIKEHWRIQNYLFPKMLRGRDGRGGSPETFFGFRGWGGVGVQKYLTEPPLFISARGEF